MRAWQRWLIAVSLIGGGLLAAWIWPWWQGHGTDAVKTRTLSWRLEEAPLTNVRAIRIVGELLATDGHLGSFDLGPMPSGLLEVRLVIHPHSTCLPDWKLAWVPVEVTDPQRQAFSLSLEAFLNTCRVRGELQRDGQVFCVLWRLPQLARQVRIGVPPHSAVRVARLEVVVPQDATAYQTPAVRQRAARFTGMFLALACGLLAVMILWPTLLSTRMLQGFLLAATLASFLLTVFLLPPFQGPDEQDHWRDALARYRRHAVTETYLYNLPEITGFASVRWHAEVHVSATLFRQASPEIIPIREPKWVNYAGYYSYPAVALVAWLFPRVHTVQEALVFYYLCRLIPVLVIAGLLCWAWRNEHLPALVLAVLSSPYVQQQCVIVSSDNLSNVAALAAGLCWLALLQQWSWAKYATLWLLTGLCFLAKPPIYVLLFVLPLWATPWRRLPLHSWYGWGLIFALGLGLGVLVLVMLWRGYQAMQQVPVADQFREQLRFLLKEGGWRYFLREPFRHALAIPREIDNWFMPLGWVDTVLHPYHLGFLRGLLYTAALVDLARATLHAPRWCHWRGCMTLGMVIVYLAVLILGTWLLTGVVMYLVVTPPRYPFIYGMQVRYLFPCVLLGLWLPMSAALVSAQTELSHHASPCLVRGNESRRCWRLWTERAVIASWAAAFVVLSVGRMIGLVGDLLARYW
ncbi:MAG: DUF2142 domain-containing protein [Gemmatales bacterium]|nr:DUF2142 domain-containing protein [Gemmatales bacterium]MDW7995019.1 DUF2142 domain-containing protein [Gemmatales bacterium]